MKKYFLILIICFCILSSISCDKEQCKKPNKQEPITACGVTDLTKNLPWLAELIDKSINDTSNIVRSNTYGCIWLEKYKGQDIFVTNMQFGSGGVDYWFLDCEGNHFNTFGWDTCPACFYVGNHHVPIDNLEDFTNFRITINMNMDSKFVYIHPFIMMHLLWKK